MRTSGAVQLRDLARALVGAGHELAIILPSPDMAVPFHIEVIDGAEVLRVRSLRTSDVAYLRRVIGECLMPLLMWLGLSRSPWGGRRWDGVIWYSPSIFHGPLVSAIKRSSRCRSYLILRDIFPEWAADMGIMGRGVAYNMLRAVARYQYRVADVIGVQARGNLPYFGNDPKFRDKKIEVLENWLGQCPHRNCTINVAESVLRGRKIFVYAGNMGVAQGLDIFLNVAMRLQSRTDIGFLFVGRGSEAARLARAAAQRNLDNMLFHDEIDPDEIPALYAQCAVGLVALDPRHRLHNIPGKFLTYMQCGLPVLANVNRGNDLADLIRDIGVGKVAEDGTVEQIARLALESVDGPEPGEGQGRCCKDLFSRQFSVEATAGQIVAALGGRAVGGVDTARG